MRLPVVALRAEYLVIGHFVRRNVLANKASPNNEDYDLIGSHSQPSEATRQMRVQIKISYATDCGRGVPISNSL